MKIALEQEDIKTLAREVYEMLKPLLSNRNEREDDVFFDVEAVSQYLIVSQKNSPLQQNEVRDSSGIFLIRHMHPHQC